MKNIFNGFGRSFTAAAVLFCMLFSILAPTIMAAESADLSFVVNAPDAKEEKDSLNYVSFGASNVNGYGLTGYLPDGVTAKDKAKENVYGYQKLPMSSYPYLVANALNNKLGGTIVGDGKTDDLRVDQPFSKVHVDQLAMSSMRAEELRFLLDTTYPGDKYTDWRFYDILGNGDSAEGNWFGKAEADIEALRKVYVDAINNADVITYDLGINNFGVFMNRAMSGSVDIDINAIDPEIAKFYNEAKAYIFENKADLIGGLADMEKMVDALAFTLVGFCVSFDATMAKIFEINPDAKVVVVSIQNLMTDLWVKVPGSEEALPLGELFGLVINAANTYTASLSKYSDKYMYADVSEEGRVEFFVDQLLAYNGDPSTLDKDMIDCYDVYDDDLNAYAQIEGLVNNLLAGIVKNGLKDVMGYLPTIYNTSDEGQLFAAYLADGADGFKRAATVANQFAEALGAGTVAYLLNAMQTTYDSFIAQKNMYMPGALAIGYDVLTECFQEAVSEFTLDFAGMSSPYKGAIENVLLASIMGLAEQEINKFAKDPTHTFSLKELYPDGFFEAVTAQINTVYPEVTVGEVKSIACFGVRTGIGNSFYGHPNKNGCKEIADTIMAAYDKGECGSAVDSKVVALRDVFVYLYENEYLTPVQVVDTAFFALENGDDTFAVVNYVYENLLLNENLDDDDRIEIIGKVYTILKGDFLGNYSPALDTVGNIYAKLVAADLLNNTEAFNIVDFVYDRLVDDYTVDEQDIYAIATYIYKTLFFTEGEMVVSLAADFDDLKDYDTALSVAEKIEIINIVFGELENSNFVEEAPELAPVLDLYTELKNDEKIGDEALVAVFDIAFEAVAEKTVNGEEVNTEALVAEVTTELATTDKIDLATKAAIVNKVAEVVKNSNLGETTETPVLPEIPDLTKIVGVLDRLDDKYITMDEANELLGKVIELFMKGELNEDTAVVLVKEAYNVVLADLSDEEKIEFIPALYEAIKAEYDLTDEEIFEKHVIIAPSIELFINLRTNNNISDEAILGVLRIALKMISEDDIIGIVDVNAFISQLREKTSEDDTFSIEEKIAIIREINIAFPDSVPPEDLAVDIIAKNVSYSEMVQIIFAVDDTSAYGRDVEVLYYLEDPALNPKAKAYKGSYCALGYTAKDGTVYPAFYTVGFPAKNIDNKIYARAHIVGTGVYSDVVEYSVVEYLLERLYLDDITEDQKDLYVKLLEYGAAAQKLLLGIQSNLCTDYVLVNIDGGTLDGKNAQGIYFPGATVRPYSEDVATWEVTTYDPITGACEKSLISNGTSITVDGFTTITPYSMVLECASILPEAILLFDSKETF